MTAEHDLRRALRGALGRPAADAIADAQARLQQDVDGVRRAVEQLGKLRSTVIATGVTLFVGISVVTIAVTIAVVQLALW